MSPVALPACLVVLRSEFGFPRGTRIDIDRSPVLVGRTPPADIVIGIVTMSRRQCRFELRDGTWWLADDASTGGTSVNDEYHSEPQALVSGDRIGLGGLRVRFLTGPDLEAQYERERRALSASDEASGV
ncbi:GGDEF family protein [Minicystis rosea]|nr:GGDEF family protein [Minicystis rosea]